MQYVFFKLDDDLRYRIALVLPLRVPLAAFGQSFGIANGLKGGAILLFFQEVFVEFVQLLGQRRVVVGFNQVLVDVHRALILGQIDLTAKTIGFEFILLCPYRYGKAE